MRGLFVFLPAEHKGAAERTHETFVSKRMHSMFYSSVSVCDLLPSSTAYLPALSLLYVVVWYKINPFKRKELVLFVLQNDSQWDTSISQKSTGWRADQNMLENKS